MAPQKMAICLWFDQGQAREAAEFYAATFPDSHVGRAHAAPSDYPAGKEGSELVVGFVVMGQAFLGLNGGPDIKPNEAVSFQIYTDDQAETDRYWNAIVGNGGQESECGWCKDKWGFSWQITPRVLMEALSAGGDEAKRAFEAMMSMTSPSSRRRAKAERPASRRARTPCDPSYGFWSLRKSMKARSGGGVSRRPE